MTEENTTGTIPDRPPAKPRRSYIIIAALLLVVIIVVGAILISTLLSRRQGGGGEPTALVDVTPSLGPTLTAGSTQAPTAVSSPTVRPTPTKVSGPLMINPDSPLFEFKSAGARPGSDWTGFFGQVLDAQGKPLSGVSVIVWKADRTPAASIVKTDTAGTYEIRLGTGALAGEWSIQVLTDDLQPASNMQAFRTDTNTVTGIQQIQVVWQQVP